MNSIDFLVLVMRCLSYDGKLNQEQDAEKPRSHDVYVDKEV